MFLKKIICCKILIIKSMKNRYTSQNITHRLLCLLSIIPFSLFFIAVLAFDLQAQSTTIDRQAATYPLNPHIQQHKAIQKQMIGIEPAKASTVVTSRKINPPIIPPAKSTNIVSIIDIGTSANAYSYGYSGGQKSILWTVPELNMVTNFHRMGGDLDPGGYSGDLGYDVSFDGGLSWENMIEIYIAENNAGGSYYTDAARYPQHGVWNPEGNTDPNNAWLSYFAPNLDESNSPGSWGGYSFGAVNIGDPTIKTKNLQSTEGPFYQYIPDAYDITKDGIVWVVDVNQDWSSGVADYQGSLILNKGVWDEAEGDFIFEQELLDAPINEATTRPSNVQIAFAEDGQTGYISFLGDNGTVDVIGGAPGLYPIIMKSIDGGNSWSDPLGIQLDGPDGLAGIVNGLLSDGQITEIFGLPNPSRDQIPYTTAFDHNISVDAFGNLHIGVVIGVVGTDDYSIRSASGFIAAYDIYTTDGGTSWYAIKLGSINQFRGTWPGDYTEDNRIQITASPDRNVMFISWLDTDLEDQEDNTRPNIFSRGIAIQPDGEIVLTCNDGADAPVNVTLWSQAMWNATFFVAAQKSFFDGNVYTIPMTYQPVAPDVDPGEAVQYKYISDFSFSLDDFCEEITPMYNLTLNVFPYGAATLNGNGTYAAGTSVTVEVNSINPGYQFTNWTDNQGTVVSEELSFTYVMPDQNVTLQANFSSCDHGWVPNPNLQFNMQVIAQIIIDDAVSTNPDDVLGAFVGEECRGIASPIDGSGLIFLSVGSNETSGEQIELKIWNSSLCDFCEAGPGFTFENLSEVGTFDNPYQVSCITDVDLNLDFGQGYTWFSENLTPEDAHPNAIFNGLEACNNDRLIGQSSFSVYYNGVWNGTINAVNPFYSYRMKLCEGQTFTATAPPAEITPIQLNAGYTWLGYLPQACLPINDALANIDPAPAANDRLIGQSSFALFTGSEWIGSLTTLCPGDGYVIKLANTSTLLYPEASPNGAMNKQMDTETDSPIGVLPEKNLQHSMTVLGQIELPAGQYSFNTNDRIYAYINDRCVGMANPMKNQDGLVFLSVGENSDEAQQVSFKIWLDDEQKLYEANELLTFMPLKGTGAYENPFKFTIDKPVNSETDWFIGEPYPNPFSEETIIPYTLNESATVAATIYNSTGQQRYHWQQYIEQAGNHQIHIPKGQLSSGIYSVKILISNSNQLHHASKTIIVM